MNEEDRNKILTAIDNYRDTGESKYPAMSYEEGMEAIIMLLDGDGTADEIT